MIQVIMFDLGGTLIDADYQAFPHAAEALGAINRRGTKSCLVSDYAMELSPAKAMKEYLAILDGAGLRSYFEPVRERVTLSNHAGVTKPDRRVFKKALARLGAASTPFPECLLITENAGHIQSVRGELKMQALQFGVDFSDWAEALSKIGALGGTGGGWVPISVPGHEDLRDIHVFSTEANPEHVEEARAFVRSLADNRQIAGRPGKPAVRATHAIETDEQGKRRLVRKRFSAM